MRIAVIGGGPAGLYFARLVKLHLPATSVDVFEQNSPDATLDLVSDSVARRAIVSRRSIRRCMIGSPPRWFSTIHQRIHLNGTDILVEYATEGGAIERLDLLQILQAACLPSAFASAHPPDRKPRPISWIMISSSAPTA